jgi:hypothetical protein
MTLLKNLEVNPRTGKNKYYDPNNSYEIQKERNIKSNAKRMYVNGKYIEETHPLHKPGRYKTFNDAAFAGTYKIDSIKEGYVYAITNPAWSGWVKIGMAIDADDRCNGYQTSSPFRDYVLEHIIVTKNRRKTEAEAHKAASKLATSRNGEWFNLGVEEAKKVLDNCSTTDKPVSKTKEQKQSAIQDLFTYAEVRT